MPAATRMDFADYIRSPKRKIQSLPSRDVADADLPRLQAIPARLEWVWDAATAPLPAAVLPRVELTS